MTTLAPLGARPFGGVGPSPWAIAAERMNPTPHPYDGRLVEWVQDELREYMWSKEQEIAEAIRYNRYVAVQSCHDVGKALDVATPIPTPTGWTTMGEINPGDWVLDEDGRPSRVTWVSRVRHNRPCIRITFDDGESIVCDEDHLWTTIDNVGRRGGAEDWRDEWYRAEVREARTVAETVTWAGQRNHRIPMTQPINLDAQTLPIPPYTLGVWLGDGVAANGKLTLNRGDAVDITAGITADGYDWHYIPSGDAENCVTVSITGFPVELRKAGLLNNKCIPDIYLRSSIDQRMDLLRGVMDTDGFAMRGAMVGCDLSDQGLAASLAELVSTMGWKPRRGFREVYLHGRRMKDNYRLNFNALEDPFTVKRKSVGWSLPVTQMSRLTCRMIVSAETVESVPVKCIAVDSPRSLFLAGRGMVPTHNSYTASRVVVHWIETAPIGDAFAVTTAPTDPQVKAILWREIGRAHTKGGLQGRVTLEAQWKMGNGTGPDELVAYGRKPADYEPTAFSGIHARRVLVVIDEAGGVSKQIFEAADTLATNEMARVLAIGNPDDPATHFAKICKPGSGWHVIVIDGLESPNFTREEVAKYPELQAYMIREGILPSTEDVPDDLRPLLLSPLWVYERMKRWGVTSPMFRSKVRGRFPVVGQNTLIEPRWVTAAANRDCERDPTDPRLAVDVARYGEDHTIIGLRLGRNFRVVRDIPKGPTTEVSGEIIRIGMALPKQPVVNVDDTGVGGGVTDELVQARYPVLPLIGGTASLDLMPNGKPRFVNARSEWWWNLREALSGQSGTGEDGVLDIDSDDEDLHAQLVGIKYEVNSHGQIKVESKDDMRKRGLPSPDRGDTLAYALVMQATIPVAMQEFMETGDLLEIDW